MHCFWVVLKKNLTLGLFYLFVSKVLFTCMVLISRFVVYTSPFWNFNFFIWHEIEDIITLVTYLRCNLQTSCKFNLQLLTSQSTLPIKGHPSVSFNFIPFQVLWKGLMELTDRKGLFFCIWNLVSKLWLVLRKCSLLTEMFLLFVAPN